MKRIIGFLVVSLFCASACRHPTPKRPKSTNKVQANKSKKEKEPTIVAPPPAYGNKIVSKE